MNSLMNTNNNANSNNNDKDKGKEKNKIMDEVITIEVAYAGKDKQIIIPLQVSLGTTAKQAINLSGILALCPELSSLASLEGRVGIFGHNVSLETVLKAWDRVEIYRSLHQDPKEARRKRAIKEAKEARIRLGNRNR